MREYQRLETGEGDPAQQTSSEVCYNVQPMTHLHKLAFVSSILFCIAVVASFLWVLPCDVATCPANQERPANVPWDITLTGIELIGGIHVVGGRVLVVSGKGAMWGKTDVLNRGVIIGLGTTLGKVNWYKYVLSPPDFMTCPPQDPPVCFTLIAPARLEAINPITGITSWELTKEEWKNLEYPVLIPDIDKDGFAEIAVIAKLESRSEIIVVSGRRGVIASRSPILSSCVSATNLTFDEISVEFHYYCSKSDDVTSEKVPVSGVIGGGIQGNLGTPDGTNDWPSSGLEGHTIEYSNTGQCPDNCAVRIQVKNPSGKKVWGYEDKQVYVMRPLPLHFKPSISGFLLKLWHWQLPSVTRSGVRIESIQERIVLLTFDSKTGTQGNCVNASQTDITRLCNITSSTVQCQPTIHTDTALIADVNGDGSQDLVSYYVTYKRLINEPGLTAPRWQLESRIRVIRLEAELPKLYEAVTSHR